MTFAFRKFSAATAVFLALAIASGGAGAATPTPAKAAAAHKAGAMQKGANNDSSVGDDEAIYDPYESFNRGMFKVNDALDEAVAKPVARAYRAIVPSPIRTGIHNEINELHTPINVANQLLQGDITGVAHDLTRFIINTLIGVGGLIDVADYMGLKNEPEDFGQTLAVWGVGPGPYTVLPIIGPSNFRDSTGLLVDSFADPVRIYLFNVDEQGWYYGRVVVTGLDEREQLLDALDDLKKNSVDYYAALRSAYYQKREALIRDQEVTTPGGAAKSAPAIPDYDSNR